MMMALVDRVKKILLWPKQEWTVIEGEAATPQQLYIGYAIPLAAIGPVAALIGSSLVGEGFGALHSRVPFGAALRSAVVEYVLALVVILVLGLIIDALAPSFGGQKNRAQALKVAVYSMTAVWIASVFAIIPALDALRIIGLYSLYLLYLGLPVLMKVPSDRAVVYTVMVIACAVVAYAVAAEIVNALAWSPHALP